MTQHIKKSGTILFFIISFIISFGLNQTRAQTSPEKILLKNYRPKSIYKIPRTDIKKAKYPIIDVHSHPYPKTSYAPHVL